MSTTVPSGSSSTPFTLQWDDSDGDDDGCWNGIYGSTTARLNDWDLSTKGTPTYYFELTTNQSTYEVFAMMTESSGHGILAYYGARFSRSSPAKLELVLTGDELVLEPTKLISGDPKIQITPTTGTPATLEIQWTGMGWQYSSGAPISGDIYLGCDSLTVTIKDVSAQGDANACALYYPLTSNTDDSSSGSVAVFQDSSDHQFSLSLTSDQIKEIPQVGSDHPITVNLFRRLDPGDHNTLRNR